MCGIFCSVFKSSSAKYTACSVDRLERLKRRGPDCRHTLRRRINDELEIELLATVLYLRGLQIVRQPVEDEQGNILLWNGEVFSGLEVTSDVNDTLLVFASLAKACNEEELLDTIKTIQGPWAFIFWQNSAQKLWFGRDVFGRRSLLWSVSPQQDEFLLSSVLSKEDKPELWSEVPAAGVYCLDFKASSNEVKFLPKLYPWLQQTPSGGYDIFISDGLLAQFPSHCLGVTVEDKYKLQCPSISHLNKTMPKENDIAVVPAAVDSTSVLEAYAVIVQQFLTVLGEAVRLRVQAQPKMCQACLESWKEARKVCSVNLQPSNENLANCSSESLPSYHEEESLRDFTPCRHSKIGVLFSGGLDSCVIAALTDRFTPMEEPIDLLNVAFQQKVKPSKQRRHRSTYQASSPDQFAENISDCTPTDDFNVPDRISGIQGYEELQKLNPQRKWNFVHINVTLGELQKEREEHVGQLISPSLTVLDDSIGCAVWFAARGSGFTEENGVQKPYTTPARVLLVGMGADEQLCGYSRHRVKFNSHGWKGLIDEIDIEIKRISSRNLGRDDRVISDHGRESRLPFLDENVVSFINSLPICYKANLTLPRGVGDKILLRVAASVLGLEKTAILAKRAIQFGSRIAKAEDKCEKGSDVCRRLKTQHM